MTQEIIGLIDYGKAGNVYNVHKALLRAGAKVEVISHGEHIFQLDKIVLPGVGSFVDGVSELKAKEMFEPLQTAILNKPTLGICLGMQILSRIGYEFERSQGLSLINAEVKRITCDLPTPHMGFNSLAVQKPNALLEGVESEKFYFMHSFEVVNYTDILALSEYGNHQFVSAIARDHIYGVQFHPEKSRDPGIEVFKNFINL